MQQPNRLTTSHIDLPETSVRTDYPFSFLIHQVANIKAMGWAAIRNGNPITRPTRLPALPVHAQHVLQAPSNDLIDSYAQWSGAQITRYRKEIPPHFCSHWAMPLLAQLGSHAPYNLLSVLNQGLRLQNHQPLLRNEALHLSGSLLNVEDDGQRIRIHTQVRAHNPRGELAMTIDSYSTVPQAKKKKSATQSTAKEMLAFDTIGTWSAQDNDGLNFAFLTGDFNPIHILAVVGKRSRFKHCILHGFGQLARTYEVILTAGYRIAELDLRWIKPLTLPNSNLQVQLARELDTEGFRSLRLLASDGSLHMVGKFKEA
jgi:acyl dehydratase